MTDDEIDKLDGPDLDAAVATEVMKWTPVWVRSWSPGHFTGGHFATEAECAEACCLINPPPRPMMLWSHTEGMTFGKGVEWSPSTNIGAAWEVVGQVRNLGLEWSFDGNGGSEGVFRWRAVVWESDLSDIARGADESMSLAICRAALRAVRPA